MPEDLLQRIGYDAEAEAASEQQLLANRFSHATPELAGTSSYAQYNAPELQAAQNTAPAETTPQPTAQNRELMKDDLEKMQASSIEQIGRYVEQLRRDELVRYGVYEEQEPLG